MIKSEGQVELILFPDGTSLQHFNWRKRANLFWGAQDCLEMFLPLFPPPEGCIRSLSSPLWASGVTSSGLVPLQSETGVIVVTLGGHKAGLQDIALIEHTCSKE